MFHEKSVFQDLESALLHALSLEKYLLASNRQAEYAVYSNPLIDTRQIARTAVCKLLNNDSDADWRACRNMDAVRSNKAKFQKLLGVSNGD